LQAILGVGFIVGGFVGGVGGAIEAAVLASKTVTARKGMIWRRSIIACVRPILDIHPKVL
jgi:hypothetical protein